jgi:shikimate dehydrogenase
MKRFGLIGKDISYSLSPLIQITIGKLSGQAIDYDLLDVEPNDIPQLIDKLKKDIYQGFNVTKPYKSVILPYLDALSPIAQCIGAVNTIYLKDGKIYGDNTDYHGFIKSLNYYGLSLYHKRVIILGSGGAARACYQALLDQKAHVKVASRAPRDDAFFKQMIGYDQLEREPVDMYLNTTHVGIDVFDMMHIKPNQSAICYDINYRPSITGVMSHFDQTYNGLVMLISQAIESQSLWLNKTIEINEDFIKEVKKVVKDE